MGDCPPDMPIQPQGGRWQQLAGEKGGEREGQRMACLASSQKAGSFPAASPGLPPSTLQTCAGPQLETGLWVGVVVKCKGGREKACHAEAQIPCESQAAESELHSEGRQRAERPIVIEHPVWGAWPE